MPIYQYKAMTPDRKSKSGIIDADSPKEARSALRKDKLLVTDIKLSKGGKSGQPNWLKKVRELQGVSGPDKKRNEQVAAVTRQMASLLMSGIPLAESLRAVIEQAPDRRIESVFRDIREKVTTGFGFGDALAQHPAYFTPLFCAMVRAGEASGALDAVLLKLSEFLQKQARMRNKVGSAMIYPIIMMVVGVLVVAVLITFVVPEITRMLESRGQDLPFATRLLMGLSDFMQNYWFWLALGIIGALIFFNQLVSRGRGQLIWHGLKLKLPIFGDLLVKQAVARFAATFSTLLRSGVPALQAIEVTRDTLNNRVLMNALDVVHKHILEGADIATPIRRSKVFPPVVGYMIAVGEQAGNLEEVLDQIAMTYDEEVDVATQKMTAALEPLIIVVLAGIVAFVILSVIMPLMQLQKVR
ncbi:MAG: type II secretion system protein GspF [Planctomycetota bacterium]|nr:MAG: type II secretion system protein GspF [Planctomycetota bacterium]